MEHAPPTNREFSWGGAILALALLGVIAVAVMAGWALIQRLEGTSPVSDSGHGLRGQVDGALLRPRSSTSVLVLNGTGGTGVAGRVANRIFAKGYREAQPSNAPVTNYARSIILYRPGWRYEATRLAQDAHVSAIAPLDGRVPAGDGRFQLVLIVGR